MGTRATWGIKKGDETKQTYVHWDGYPTGLEYKVAKVIDKARESVKDEEQLEEELRYILGDVFNRIRMVGHNAKAPSEDIERLKQYSDTTVSEGDLEEYYVLLRKLQEEPAEYVSNKGLDIMLENNGDNEWSYIIDIDNLEIQVEDIWGGRTWRIPAVERGIVIEGYMWEIENSYL